MRALLTGLLATSALAQTVYSWTDADGVVNYTDTLSNVPKSAVKLSASVAASAPEKAPDTSLLRSFERPHWRHDVETCAKALRHAQERQEALRVAEATLNEMKRAFAPCTRYQEICWSKNLSRPTWERECRQRPPGCAIQVGPQETLVEGLRDEVAALPEWLQKLGVWGCVK